MSRRSKDEEQPEEPITFFDTIWTSLESVFRSKLKPETKGEWQRQLAHIPDHAIRSAVRSICQSEDRMPSLGMIMRYSRNFLPGLNATRHSEGEDDAGVKCWYWEDEGGKPSYRAQDCEEGRQFLAKLKKLSLAKDMKKPRPSKGPFEITPEIVEKVIARGRK